MGFLSPRLSPFSYFCLVVFIHKLDLLIKQLEVLAKHDLMISLHNKIDASIGGHFQPSFWPGFGKNGSSIPARQIGRNYKPANLFCGADVAPGGKK